MRIPVAIILLAGLPVLLTAASSCRSEQDGPTAHSAAALTVATNFNIGGPSWLHETAVAAVNDPNGANNHWIVFANNCQDPNTCGQLVPAWSVSENSMHPYGLRT